MIDLYQGTLGLKHNKDSLVKSLIEYLIRTDEDLTYGVKEVNTKVMIITGKNELESKIPTFYHPTIFDYKGDTYVAMDMRLFVSKPKDDINIEKLLRDTNNGNIALYRLILTKMFLDNDLRFLLAVNRSVFDMFSSVINVIYRNTTMDSQLLPYVSLGCNYHYATFELKDKLHCNDIHRALFDNVLNVVKVSNPNLVSDLINMCSNGKIPNPSMLIGDLVDVIGEIGKGTRVNKITPDVLIMTLSRSFFALNSNELSIAFIESKANMIAILYGILSNSFQKKSILYRTIDFGKRYNNMKEFVSTMDRVIKEQIVR